ncbi:MULTISPECIES: glutaminase [unclassified Microbacterium]|uniref:glutaminase n=1 Tax=unclassified Microbacterium TaxID=2609290 RepID=UPI0037453155
MRAEEILDGVRRRLVGVPREGLGDLRAARRTLGFPRAARIVPAGEAWHLGALLVTDEGIAATGDIVRAHEEVRRGFTAESQRRRAELAGAARRGGFAEGQIVHVGWRLLDLDRVDATTSPLLLSGDTPMVRWSATGAPAPLQRYLDERVELLQHPPAGA